MKKTLFLSALTVLGSVSCFADKIADMSGTVFISHPEAAPAAGMSGPVLFSIAAGVMMLLGVLRPKHNAQRGALVASLLALRAQKYFKHALRGRLLERLGRTI